jgi:beta-N-acetylhexosaminidase
MQEGAMGLDRPARLVTALLLAGALAALAAGCGSPLPNEEPSIRGTVVSVLPAGDFGSIAVEASGSVASDYDKAVVRITQDTALLTETERGAQEAPFSALRAGTRVEVWFEGPVAESYPVQATAGTVLIVR